MFSKLYVISKQYVSGCSGLAQTVVLGAVLVFLQGCTTVAPGDREQGADMMMFFQGLSQIQNDAYARDQMIRQRNEETGGNKLPMRPVYIVPGGTTGY